MSYGTGRSGVRVAGPVLVGLLVALATGCSAGSDGPVRQAPPPPPPAACLLDGAALAATTGLTWTPDQSIATDTRCVYDPAGSPGPAGFLAVDVSTTTVAPAEQLDTIAELCDAGSRARLDTANGGFVCRFGDGNVYAALVRGGQLVTVATSAVPAGTTAARIVVALTEQLTAIAG